MPTLDVVALVERGAVRLELPPQQVRIVALIAQDYANKRIAAEMFISENTVDSHVMKSFRRLDVHSRVALVVACVAAGIDGGQHEVD